MEGGFRNALDNAYGRGTCSKNNGHKHRQKAVDHFRRNVHKRLTKPSTQTVAGILVAGAL